MSFPRNLDREKKGKLRCLLGEWQCKGISNGAMNAFARKVNYNRGRTNFNKKRFRVSALRHGVMLAILAHIRCNFSYLQCSGPDAFVLLAVSISKLNSLP